MSLLTAIPVELVDAVFALLPPPELASLARTCSCFLSVASRRLYRDLFVGSSSHTLSVVVTLARRPSLARHVQSLTVNVGPKSTIFRSFYRQLSVALQNMANITMMSLYLPEGTSWVLGADSKVYHPNLTRLFCSFPLDCHVKSFLERAPALLTLELGSLASNAHRGIILPPACVPSLRDFTGSFDAALVIVPGRPLEVVRLTNPSSSDEVSFEFLTLATAKITSFGACTTSHPVILIQKLPQCMPALTYLAVTTTYSFSTLPNRVSLTPLPSLS